MNDFEADEMQTIQAEDGLIYFQSKKLQSIPGLFHGFFTRKGGVSTNNFHSLNVGLSTSDTPKNTDENRRRVLSTSQGQTLLFLQQVHGAKVHIPLSNAIKETRPVCEADALVTNTPGAMLMIQTADCQPILLFDPNQRVAAAIHSGWRGSVQNIVKETVEKMIRRYNCCPQNIIAAIGPSLGPCCAEFLNYKNELPKTFWDYKNTSHYFDFWKITENQLKQEGLLTENIKTSRLCTRCNEDLFFSYRRDKETGRLASVIGISE